MALKRVSHGFLFRLVRKIAVLIVAVAVASCLNIWLQIKDRRIINLLFAVIAFGTYLSLVRIEAALQARWRSSKIK